MIYRGYRLNGYNATYEKAVFNVVEQQDGVLEIADLESGVTILIDFDSAPETERRRTSKWRKDEPKEQHGTSITFGRKGLFEQLKYTGRKPKQGV